jgi:hypothetical protein
MPDNPSEEERERMVKDAMKTLYPPEQKTQEKLLVERMKDISRDVHKDFMKLQVIEPRAIADKTFRYEKMCDMYTDKMRSMNKEEILFIAVMLLTEAHIEHV